MGQSMRSGIVGCTICVMWLSSLAGAATKVHVISFGKWTAVTWNAGADDKPVTMKVRALMVDGRVKEYVTGAPHDVTDRVFVARRVFRGDYRVSRGSGGAR